MAYLEYIGQNLLAAALLEIPVFLILGKFYWKSGRKTAAYLIFVLYISEIYALVGLPTVTYLRFEPRISLIPFVGMAADFRNSVLNVMLFLPLGLLLPIVWQTCRSFPRTFLWGLGLSTAIEFLQIFSGRATDVNDLITNTAGCLLGYFLSALLISAAPKVFASDNNAGDIWLLLGISGAVMFFLHPVAIGWLL